MTVYHKWALELMRDRVPFIAKGRDRRGLDCWGVVCLAHKELEGRSLPSYTPEYDTVKDLNGLNKIFSREVPLWHKVERGKEQPGDVIILRVRGLPVHVGLIVNKGYMLHIEQSVELCVENYESIGWRNRVTGIYRYAG